MTDAARQRLKGAVWALDEQDSVTELMALAVADR